VHIEPVSGAMDTFVQRSPSKAAAPGGKRTKKVLVQKSFVDEKGYFVTESVWEEQEVDEPSPAPASPTKSKPPVKSEPAVAPGQKRKAEEGGGGGKKKDVKAAAAGTKQRSMLNFFGKKK